MLKGQQILRWEPKVSEFSGYRAISGSYSQDWCLVTKAHHKRRFLSQRSDQVGRQGWQKVGLEAKRTQFRGLYIGRCPVHWRCLKIALISTWISRIWHRTCRNPLPTRAFGAQGRYLEAPWESAHSSVWAAGSALELLEEFIKPCRSSLDVDTYI